MKSSAKPYISAKLFLDYVQTVFRPNLAELRRLDELDEFAEEMALSLMDHCLSCITSVVM
jgi:hypothetical protein